MTFTAHVYHGTIALPADLHVADGAEVQVVLPEKLPADSLGREEPPDWLRKAMGAATTGLSTDEIMRRTRAED